jgi:NAD(P)-dependent dehydrogenase (short-subunit alcohol dehydrogenase family)
VSAPVVIVAGAGGAGAAAAQSLAAEGARVIVIDRTAAKAEQIAEASSTGDIRAEGFGLNLLDLDAASALRDDLLSRHGRVDALIHLVGGWKGAPQLGPDSVANWSALHPPIVGTLAVLTAVFGDSVRSAGAGRILMVTSTTAVEPSVSNIAYAAAKRAAEGWMDGLADFFRDSPACSVTIAVKALLTDAMTQAEPGREWAGYTHVDELAATMTRLTLGPAVNGSRLDLTTHPTHPMGS